MFIDFYWFPLVFMNFNWFVWISIDFHNSHWFSLIFINVHRYGMLNIAVVRVKSISARIPSGGAGSPMETPKSSTSFDFLQNITRGGDLQPSERYPTLLPLKTSFSLLIKQCCARWRRCMAGWLAGWLGWLGWRVWLDGWVVGLAGLTSLLGWLGWFRWLGWRAVEVGKVGTFWFRLWYPT